MMAAMWQASGSKANTDPRMILCDGKVQVKEKWILGIRQAVFIMLKVSVIFMIFTQVHVWSQKYNLPFPTFPLSGFSNMAPMNC